MLPSTLDMVPSPSTWNPRPSTLDKKIDSRYASTKTGCRLPDVQTLHNQNHLVLGGAMRDEPSASNDLIFPLHHFFVDRIYEKWLRKFKKNASVLSSYDAPIGHNKDDVITNLSCVYSSTDV